MYAEIFFYFNLWLRVLFVGCQHSNVLLCPVRWQCVRIISIVENKWPIATHESPSSEYVNSGIFKIKETIQSNGTIWNKLPYAMCHMVFHNSKELSTCCTETILIFNGNASISAVRKRNFDFSLRLSDWF